MQVQATGSEYNCTDGIAQEIVLIALKHVGSICVSHVAKRVLCSSNLKPVFDAKLWMFGSISSHHLYCVIRSSFKINN